MDKVILNRRVLRGGDSRIDNLERNVRRPDLPEYIYKRILKKSWDQPTEFIYKRIL